MPNRNIAGYIDVTVVVRWEGQEWVSWCPEFDIASCGGTVEEATAALVDALELYLNTLEGEGQRERVFAERDVQTVPLEELNRPIRHFVSQQHIPIPA